MATRNHPCRWTCKSTRHLAEELQRQGYRIGDPKIAALLRQMGYSLQANAKIIQGGRHLDRNAQFAYVNAQTKKFLAQGLPVISVDKKKELVGNYSHRGQEWQPQGEPEKTLIHDFPDQERGQRSVRSAKRCRPTFHSRDRLALLPPASARISNSVALG